MNEEANVLELTNDAIQKDYKTANDLVVKMETHIALWLKARGIKGVLTDNCTTGNSPIYGYYLDHSYGTDEVRESVVKAIMLDEKDHIYVVMDMPNIIYDIDCIKNRDYEKSNEYTIFGSDCYGWFTLIDICESLYDFDDEEYYIK